MYTAVLERESYVATVPTVITPLDTIQIPDPTDTCLHIEPCPVCEGWAYADMKKACPWCTNGLIDSRYLPWILLGAEMQGDLDDDMLDLCAEICAAE